MIPCPECGGVGDVEDTRSTELYPLVECSFCRGSGEVDPIEYDADVLLRALQRDDWAEWDWRAP